MEASQNLNLKEFEAELRLRAVDIERILRRYLPKEEGYTARVAEAMNYSVLGGGKRLRPILCAETFRMYGGTGNIIDPFLAAIEMIHSYSLVHDDLPSMDNDEYRRGRKTTHAVYGPGMATLAGDGLLNLAFETALKAFDIQAEAVARTGLQGTEDFNEASYGDPKRIVMAMQILGDKSGINGMLGGQSADVDAEKRHREVGFDELLFIHEKKTGALIECALMIGAALSWAPLDDIKLLESAGHCIGMAFQIRDDILDVEGDEAALGKKTGSDEKLGKATYVSLFGMDKAKSRVKELSEKALSILGNLSQEDEFLMKLVEYLVNREK